MKSKILLVLAIVCITKALQQYKNFEYLTSFAVLEAPLRLLNERVKVCYKEIEPDYRKLTDEFKNQGSSMYTNILHYLNQRSSAKVALLNLKLISIHMKTCQEDYSRLIPAQNFTEAAFVLWECRKTLKRELKKFSHKMDIFRYDGKEDQLIVNITVEYFLKDYYEKTVNINKKFKTCINSNSCTEEKCAFELGL